MGGVRRPKPAPGCRGGRARAVPVNRCQRTELTLGADGRLVGCADIESETELSDLAARLAEPPAAIQREPAELMDDNREFLPIDAEQARTLPAVKYQGIRTAIDLNTQLAAHVDRVTNAAHVNRVASEEAHRLNDAILLTMNDVKRRMEAVIGSAE